MPRKYKAAASTPCTLESFPRISAALQMTESIAFPYAISPYPVSAEVVETITSGSVVTMDTTAAPVKSPGR